MGLGGELGRVGTGSPTPRDDRRADEHGGDGDPPRAGGVEVDELTEGHEEPDGELLDLRLLRGDAPGALEVPDASPAPPTSAVPAPVGPTIPGG